MSIEENKKDLPIVKILLLGLGIWFVALAFATIVMMAIGVDFSDPDLEFGWGHEQYWLFELIIQPIFLVFSMIALIIFYRREGIDREISINYDGAIYYGFIGTGSAIRKSINIFRRISYY